MISWHLLLCSWGKCVNCWGINETAKYWQNLTPCGSSLSYFSFLSSSPTGLISTLFKIMKEPTIMSRLLETARCFLLCWERICCRRRRTRDVSASVREMLAMELAFRWVHLTKQTFTFVQVGVGIPGSCTSQNNFNQCNFGDKAVSYKAC